MNKSVHDAHIKKPILFIKYDYISIHVLYEQHVHSYSHPPSILCTYSICSIIIYSHETQTDSLIFFKKEFHYMEFIILKLSHDTFNVKLYTNVINDLFTISLKMLI